MEININVRISESAVEIKTMSEFTNRILHKCPVFIGTLATQADMFLSSDRSLPVRVPDARKDTR